MHFEQGHLYHIYNQGNNKQTLFFNRENYLFFLSKIKKHITPHANIVAWCLMPNHFHLMIEVKEQMEVDSEGFTQSEPFTKHKTLNDEIGIILRSYTRAINKQEGKTGSLFRKETKAECITKTNGITPSFYNTEYGASIHTNHPEEEYPQVCFNYIHLNPLKAGLVSNTEDWEFSSYQDYYGIRKGKIVNKDCVEKYGIKIS